MLKILATALALCVSVSALADANLFESTTKLTNKSASLTTNRLQAQTTDLFIEAKVDKTYLKSLKKSDSVSINLPDTHVNGKVIKTFTGKGGSQHVVIRSFVHDIPVNSVVTLGDNAVYMELITDEGSYSAAGSEKSLLVYKQHEINVQQGISFHDDFLIPPSFSGSQSNKTASYLNNIGQDNAYNSAYENPANTSSAQTPGINQQFGAYQPSQDFGDIATIGLLIVYTNNSFDIVDDVEAKIDHFVAYTNEAFEASGIFAKVEVRNVVSVDYPYNDGGDGLRDITNGIAPFEDVADLRIQANADAVVLISPQNDNDSSAGIAWLNTHINRQSYEFMYSQVDIDFDASVFAHELGHNLGLGHSRQQGSVGGDFSYGVGYRIPIPNDVGFSTIMSYDVRDAEPISYFSNPSLMCGTIPCGVPKEDENFGADAVNAVNAVRDIVASYSESITRLIPISEALSQVSDPELKACIANRVNDDVLYASDVNFISCRQRVAALDGLENFSSLTTLYLNSVGTSDLSILEEVKSLTSLSLRMNLPADFSFLANLPLLQRFDIAGFGFDNAQARNLASVKRLRQLFIASDTLDELPDLSELKFLESVDLYADVRSLDSVSGNNLLRKLTVWSGALTSFPSSFSWPLLEELNIQSTPITSVAALNELTNLKQLTLRDTQVASLQGIENSKDLTQLYVSSNNLSDISSVSSLTNLEYLDISNNPIVDVSPIQGLTELKLLFMESINTGDVPNFISAENMVEFAAGSAGYTSNWNIIDSMGPLQTLRLRKVSSTDLALIAELNQSLTTLALLDVEPSDLSALLFHYRVEDLTLTPAVGTQFYCWQASYLRELVQYSEAVGGACSTQNDNNDFDGDGTSNADELALGTNPTVDDRPPSTLSFDLNNVRIYEDPINYETIYTAIVERKGNTAIESSVDVDVEALSATSGRDFNVDSNRLTFPKGSSFARLRIRVYDDFELEGQESFSIQLSNPVNAELTGITTLTVSLFDDNNGDDFEFDDDSEAPSVGWSNYYMSVNELDSSIDIVVNRPEGLIGSFSVNVSALALTDNTESSFELMNSVLSFGIDDDFLPVTVKVSDDNVQTGSKFVSLRLEEPQNVIIQPDLASLTLEIKDDETADYEMGFQNSLVTVSEGVGSVPLTLVRSAPYDEDIPFTIAQRSFGKAELGVDATFNETSFVFPAGATTFTFELIIIDDNISERLENLELIIEGVPNSLINENNFVSVYIEDNDAEPTGEISFSTFEMYLDESDGTVDVPLRRTQGTTGVIVVTVSPNTGTASGNDFSFQTQEVTFLEGEENKTIQFTINDDVIEETTEKFTLSLASEIPGTIGSPDVLTVSIDDNDEPVPGVLGFSSSNVTVGESTGTLTVTVRRTNGSSGELSTEVTAQAGTASSSDYSFTPTTLTFADGETQKTVSLQIVDDTLEENAESFTLQLSGLNGTQISSNNTLTITISANDASTSSGGNNENVSNGGSSGGGSMSYLLMMFILTGLIYRRTCYRRSR